MTTWAIVVAAGRGERFGRPKQFERLAGRRVVDWALDDARDACDGVVLVVPPGHDEPSGPRGWLGEVPVVVGGDSRSESVRRGLASVPEDAEVIVVHDAARPAAGVGLFRAVIDAVRAGADGAVPGVAVVDTVKRVDGDVVVETLDRRTLVAVQTPQAFRASALRSAHAAAAEATDDAALVERAGGKVVVVPGHLANRKITEPGDLDAIEQALG
ncbi:MAG TPA: 2-C-methyl-D-erythritol 4-phosphate cytidylyltransferase [Acidimicrobiales bacterium]|nr:2-C-methyl-D-erythritol 4-phosphate cytidylyltransferase [Acidimicrobiales bacterium]